MNKVDYVLKVIRKVCPYAHIDAETELIDSEILSSLDLFDLIAELEAELDIRIPEELIVAENFSTAKIIASTVLSEVMR